MLKRRFAALSITFIFIGAAFLLTGIVFAIAMPTLYPALKNDFSNYSLMIVSLIIIGIGILGLRMGKKDEKE
jgi:hypothetical protein